MSLPEIGLHRLLWVVAARHPPSPLNATTSVCRRLPLADANANASVCRWSPLTTPPPLLASVGGHCLQTPTSASVCGRSLLTPPIPLCCHHRRVRAVPARRQCCRLQMVPPPPPPPVLGGTSCSCIRRCQDLNGYNNGRRLQQGLPLPRILPCRWVQISTLLKLWNCCFCVPISLC